MADITEIIRERRSLRLPFDPARPVEEAELRAILEAARWAPTAHNMQNFEIVVVDDPELLRAVEGIDLPISETFVRENYEQLSFSVEELRERKTGLLGTMFPEAWRRPDFSVAQLTADEVAALRRGMPSAPVLLVVTYDPSRRAPASAGDFLGIVSLGCIMENMWLAAASLGVGMHIVSSLSGSPELKRLLRIPDHLTVAFSCRLGYPAADAPDSVRVRRDVEDFAHWNGYAE